MSNENQGDQAVSPMTQFLDRRAVLGWATVRAGLALLLGGATLSLVGGILLMRVLGEENRRPNDLAPAILLLLLVVPGLVLIVTGTSMGLSVPKGTKLRERAWAFLCGVGILAGLGAALTSTLIEKSRAESLLHGHDVSGAPLILDRLLRAEKAFALVRNSLVVVALWTELFYLLFLHGGIACLRGRPLARTPFHCLLLAFALQIGALALAWWKPEAGLPDPSGWDMEYVRWAMVVSGLLALWLLLMAGRAHQTITEVLLRR